MEVELDGRTVRLTHLDRVVFPEAGFTKADVVDYYVRVAGAILPHLRGRPLTLRRFPNGVGGSSRYQKCCPDRRPEWLSVADVWLASHHAEKPFCLVDDLPSLVWSANQNNLELHPMLARAPEVDEPTVVAFDLDPGPPAGLMEAAEVALLLRDVLAGVGLRSWVKTSGGKGMQVFAPLNTPGVTYAETKGFARAVARLLAAELPERVVATVTRRERAGRVLVDWGQNDRHRSIVCAWSLRGRPLPTVSTPLAWEELEAARSADDLVFSPAAAVERLEREGDPFAPVLSEVQALPGGGA
ncbi:MAG TPA: non-homologous end-joining DNA ligase [Solirubrobacteraceae bacterium]|nr:non-homologous end-joining DNA ligase [Solirubrobacteraceae bacterium]